MNIKSNNLLELLKFIDAFGYRKLLEAYIVYTRIYGYKGKKNIDIYSNQNSD